MAAWRSSDARMAAMMASIMSSALIRPSTMWARSRAFLQPELGPAPDDLDLVVDVGLQGLDQVEGPGHPVDQGHHVDAEAGLQRGVLVQVVEHHVGVGVALELDLELGVRPLAEASLASRMPSSSRASTSSLIRVRTDRGLTW